MTLVLIGKGLALGGWPWKIEVIWVPGIYIYIFRFQPNFLVQNFDELFQDLRFTNASLFMPSHFRFGEGSGDGETSWGSKSDHIKTPFTMRQHSKQLPLLNKNFKKSHYAAKFWEQGGCNDKGNTKIGKNSLLLWGWQPETKRLG